MSIWDYMYNIIIYVAMEQYEFEKADVPDGKEEKWKWLENWESIMFHLANTSELYH